MNGQKTENGILRWSDVSWDKRFIDTRKYYPDRGYDEAAEERKAAKYFSEEESRLSITSAQKKGKVTDCGYDAFACCYTALPADRDIQIRADLRITAVPESGVLNDQEAFGIFFRDTMDKDPETGHYYSNMAAAGMWRGVYDFFGREGITADGHSHVENFSMHGSADAAAELLPDTVVRISLTRKGNTVSAEITDMNGRTLLSGEDACRDFMTDSFCCRDRENIYAGFMAARGYGMEIEKDSVEITTGDLIASGEDADRHSPAEKADPFLPPDYDIDMTGSFDPDDIIWASPDGTPDGDGSSMSPYDLFTAVESCGPGAEIKLMPGRYLPDRTVVLSGDELHGTGRRRRISGTAAGDERAVIDFGNTLNCLNVTGSMWDVEDIDVTRGGGIWIEGHYNRIRGCRAYRNNETGILIRHHDNDSPRIEWPSYNLIEDCSSYENCDPSQQHADGFACKVAAGEGNRFIGCRAYMNSDDGFDLFAKNRKTGAVVIENCESSRNGFIYDEEGNLTPSEGNGNGFKLGGSGERVDHIVRNSVARRNRGCGFTSNSNPSMILTGCKGSGNERGNLGYYVYSDKAEQNKVITDCDLSDDRKVMIDIQHISKDYRLGQIGHGTLQRDLQSWWAKRRGREDPNSKIGQEQRLSGDILHALSDISLKVYQGERVGIIGSNGAGKSTLLKIISRVASPTSGSIDLYGRVTSMLEVGTGFHGDMTGRENIYLNGAILGMNRSEIDSKIEEIIDFSEVREYIDTPVKRYSSGMYVRLAFSVASHLDSEIVIMDEVLAVGDVAFQKKCIAKMQQSVLDENRTVLYVSHNLNTVRDLCDRCIVLAEGKILFDGEVEDAIRCYTDYLQSTQDEEPDLLLRERRDRKLTGKCRLAGVSVAKDTFRTGEDIRFELRLKSEEDRRDVRIRLVVCNGPGEIVGMTFSEPMHLSRGMTKAAFSLPPGCLAPGEYACDIAVFEFRKDAEEKHDFLNKVLTFRISEQKTYFGRQWKIRTWGNVLLENIVTEEIIHEQQE